MTSRSTNARTAPTIGCGGWGRDRVTQVLATTASTSGTPEPNKRRVTIASDSMLDDVVLWLQSLVDRLGRWVRLRVPARTDRRRFLIVQIDGLSRETLERAIHSGGVPAISRLMAMGR